jgi:putative nucleotidyltransferase with HDIG domain
MAAGKIARDQRMNPDVAFMGGLLHDIGKLIMLETFADDYTPEQWMTTFSKAEMLYEELRMFSFTHDKLGGRLLQKWLFPENLISAVAYHHRPGEAGSERAFAQIIQLADVLSYYSCNKDLLEENDILTAVYTSLPDVQAHWHGCAVPLKNKVIIDWFDWLVDNQKHGSQLQEAFSV